MKNSTILTYLEGLLGQVTPEVHTLERLRYGVEDLVKVLREELSSHQDRCLVVRGKMYDRQGR